MNTHAIAAGKYTMDGKVEEYTGPLSKELAEMVAIMCAANTMYGKNASRGIYQV